jgi:hypothetical protein
VHAIADLRVPDPSNVKVAIALVKRYAPRSDDRIRMRDFVRDALNRTSRTLSAIHEAPWDSPNLLEGVPRVHRYDAAIEPLAAAVAVGCCWADAAHDPTWRFVLTVLGEINESGTEVGLRRYPALRVLYAAAIACVVAEKYQTLKLLFEAPMHTVGGTSPAIDLLLRGDPLRQELAQLVMQETSEKKQNWFVPTSEHLFRVSRVSVAEFLPTQVTYEAAFDRFEMLAALACLARPDALGAWAPIGRFGWKQDHSGDYGPVAALKREIVAAGSAWGPALAGLFPSGDAIALVDQLLANVSRRPWF